MSDAAQAQGPVAGTAGTADTSAADAARAASAAHISEQLPRRRRRLGLALVGLGVLALAAQGWGEWLLPYDLAALEWVRRLSASPTLAAGPLVWLWALLCGALLLALALAGRRPWALALLCAVALGSAHAAAGGAAASLAMLLLVGVASLGWQARREGGLVLLLGTALTLSAWDAALSNYPTLWQVALVLSGMFFWIDRQHIRGNDHRLFSALAERDALITRLDQRTHELTALQGARTRLLASISHDLRQPLQAVRLFAEALQARSDVGAAAAGLLRQQMRAADDAVAMLDQFSEISAIEQGALQSHPEPVDLRELLDGVAANLRATHPESLLRLRVHGRRRWVLTDRSQLGRVVQNLAGNAVRYSLGAQSGRRAHVLLALRPHTGPDGDPGLSIEVLDNGRGIPADKLQAVFEPYVQLGDGAAGASRGGRGLGLAIVRGLVAQLGLQMAPLQSVPGRGTRVRVRVPAAMCCPAPGAAGENRARERVDPRRLDGWLLALLDDEAGPRAALRAALEGVGATLVDAGSLEQLKARLDEEARFPDALVLDLDLGPGRRDGLAALTELRADWDLPVPAVIVTGRIAALGTVPLPQRCSLLAKPVALATLVATLRRVAPQGGPTAVHSAEDMAADAAVRADDGADDGASNPTDS